MVQIRASSSARYSQHLANLRVRKPFNIVQHYHCPRPRLQLRECSFETLPQFGAFRWIAERSRNGFRERFSVPYFLAPGEIQRRVGDDPIEPRTERLSRVEPIESLVCTQKGFLNRVLCVLMGHDDRSGHDICPALMKPHEASKTSFVALSGQTYKLSFLIGNT
jgi:hypothetical protein